MSTAMIPFNRPHLCGNEQSYIIEAMNNRKLAGNGPFTKLCQQKLQQLFGLRHVMLTTSCTDALEMAALLLDIVPEDEVIMPAYTFVSTANPFVLRGAKVVFVDSRSDHPGMDESTVEALITPRTKAIVVVHYAGVACDMDSIMDIAARYNLKVVEDAAQAIDAYYKGRPLGSIGHLGAYSFHETKNIQCGEGGALMVNEPELIAKAEILWEKGTNRAAFFRGEVDKYNWVGVGSSFLPSELLAAFLLAQLESMHSIQQKRIAIWDMYAQELKNVFASGNLISPHIPAFATNNGHMFHIVCQSVEQRDRLMIALKEQGINSVFHYQALHASPFFNGRHDGRPLPNSIHYSNCLLRLPLFVELSLLEVERICNTIKDYYA